MGPAAGGSPGRAGRPAVAGRGFARRPTVPGRPDDEGVVRNGRSPAAAPPGGSFGRQLPHLVRVCPRAVRAGPPAVSRRTPRPLQSRHRRGPPRAAGPAVRRLHPATRSADGPIRLGHCGDTVGASVGARGHPRRAAGRARETAPRRGGGRAPDRRGPAAPAGGATRSVPAVHADREHRHRHRRAAGPDQARLRCLDPARQRDPAAAAGGTPARRRSTAPRPGRRRSWRCTPTPPCRRSRKWRRRSRPRSIWVERERYLEISAEQSRAAEIIADDRYRSGLDDYITVLESQRLALQAEGDLIAARRQRLENRVDLYLALGGGFDLAPAMPGSGD